MWIGIDGGPWGNRRGYGRFARELIGALVRVGSHHRYSLFLDRHSSRAEIAPEMELIEVRTRRAASDAASADGYRSLGDIWAVSRTMARTPVELLFFPSVYTYVPVLRRVPLVVTVHDAIPEQFPGQVFKNARARTFWRVKVRLALLQATRILTVSEHAKAAITTHLGVPPDRIEVTGEAAASVFYPRPAAEAASAFAHVGLAAGSKTIMYVGGMSPHKNLEMLLDVYADLIENPAFADLKLLMVGDPRDRFFSSYPAIRSKLDATPLPGVRFTGYLNDDVVARLMSTAQALVLPSFDEGFGLPAVEAAACGAPVVATRSSALPAVLGEAGAYFDPRNREEFRAVLTRVLSDPALRQSMRAAGLERACRLTWDAAAVRVLDVFERLLGADRPS